MTLRRLDPSLSELDQLLLESIKNLISEHEQAYQGYLEQMNAFQASISMLTGYVERLESLLPGSKDR